MGTLRDCAFAYVHEVAGHNMDEEVKIVTLKRTDLDFTLQVCESCAAGLIAAGSFVVASDESQEVVTVSEELVSEAAAALEEIIAEERGDEGSNEGNGEGDN